MLVRVLVETDVLPVERSDGAVCGAEIDADVGCHLLCHLPEDYCARPDEALAADYHRFDHLVDFKSVVWAKIRNVEGGNGHSGIVGLTFEIDDPQAHSVEPGIELLLKVPQLARIPLCLACIELHNNPGKESRESPAFNGDIDQGLTHCLRGDRVAVVHKSP